MRIAALSAAALLAAVVGGYGLSNIYDYDAIKNEPIPTPITQPITPLPTNAEIMKSIDDMLTLNNEPAYDGVTDHRAEVLSLADKIYRTLNEGRTLEQDNPTIKFQTGEEWKQLTSTPDDVRLRDAYGFITWENTENRKDKELTMYIRGNIPVWSALSTVAHEAGIAQVKRPDGPKFDMGDANWYWARGEAAGFLSEAAFLRKMEEAGLEWTKYENTEINISYTKYLLEKDIWKTSEKDAYFDTEGQLNADDTTDITLGMWYGTAMFALDPNLADVKKRIEQQGRTTSEDNMKLIKRIIGTTTYTFRDHYKSLLNAKTYNKVLEWVTKVLTSPERLNGSQTYPYPNPVYPMDLLP